MKTLTGAITVRGLLAEGAAALQGAGVPTARQDSEWLLADTLGVGRGRLYLDSDRPVSAEITDGFRGRIRRRVAHQPLQHILGFEEFRGLRLRSTPAALIPRPETELLVEWALELRHRYGPWRIAVDVGTGTGAIALALADALPNLRVVAVERSLGALAVAAANVAALGLGSQVRLVACDLLAALGGLGGQVDLVVSNPPYCLTGELATLPSEVRLWEPWDALDGGPDGMAFHRLIVAQSPGVLRSGGWLLMEMCPGQAEALGRVMEAHGFERIEVRTDLRGLVRMIGGRRG